MTRRSPPQRQKDDAAFPVRVKVIVPSGGFGRLHVAMLEWLDRGPGQGDYACHGAEITGTGYDATAFYFRDVETAQAFVAAFPEIVLADGTDLSTYSSPRLPFGRPQDERQPVCNLYSMTRSQDAMRRLFDGLVDRTGHMPPLPGNYPDHEAPIVRNASGGPGLVMARWGLPSPPSVLEGKARDPGVTNVRNTGSPHWRRWLGPEHRCEPEDPMPDAGD